MTLTNKIISLCVLMTFCIACSSLKNRHAPLGEPLYYEFDPATKYVKYRKIKLMFITNAGDTVYLADQTPDNIFDGKGYYIYHDSIVIRKYSIKNGLIEGIDEFFEFDGTKTMDCFYVNGHRDSCIYYSVNGTIDSVYRRK